MVEDDTSRSGDGSNHGHKGLVLHDLRCSNVGPLVGPGKVGQVLLVEEALVSEDELLVPGLAVSEDFLHVLQRLVVRVDLLLIVPLPPGAADADLLEADQLLLVELPQPGDREFDIIAEGDLLGSLRQG